MTYELAQQLKDAGFKCEHRFDDKTRSFCLKCPFYEDYQPYVGPEREGMAEMCYPTLSELIEACGENFYALWRSKNEWRASHKIGVLGDQDHEAGSTPEEAVAKLWLALNKGLTTNKE